MKRKLYTAFVVAAALVMTVSCQRNDDQPSEQAESKGRLGVSVVEVAESVTQTKGGAEKGTVTDTVWLNDSVYVDAVVSDIVTNDESQQTRATMINEGKEIKDLTLVMFNTQGSTWSASSTQESGKSPMTAVVTNGTFTISPSYPWLEGDLNYRTLIAIAPSLKPGLTLNNGGRTLDITVQSDVKNQYDVCVSDISKNKNMQNTVGSNKNIQKFEMNHVMAAIGFEAMGYDLKVTKIKIRNIQNKASIDLTTTNPSWNIDPSSKVDFEVTPEDKWLSVNHIDVDNPWNNITPTDGYMMMLPQTLSDDVILDFTFEGRNGQPGGTYSVQLNQITRSWTKSQRIIYRLRLKSRPAVLVNNFNLNSYQAGSYVYFSGFIFDNIVSSKDDNLTFSWTASWLGLYRGTDLIINNPESNGYFPPFTTGVNDWKNLKLFARNENSSFVASRSAQVTVTGTKSGTKTFTVTQPKNEYRIKLSLNGTWTPRGIGGDTQTITVDVVPSYCKWKLVVPENDGKWKKFDFSRTEGNSGDQITLTVKGNPHYKERNLDLIFEIIRTDPSIPYTSVTKKITQKQIITYEVSTEHTQFVPANVINVGILDNANTKRAWMDDQNGDLLNTELAITSTGGYTSSSTDGWWNSNVQNWGWSRALDYCRKRFGPKGYSPAVEQIPLMTINNIPPATANSVRFNVNFALKWNGYYEYFYMSSTVQHLPNQYWSMDYVRIAPYARNVYREHSVVQQRGYYHYHRCFVREDTF